MAELVHSHLMELIQTANHTFEHHFAAGNFVELANLYTHDGIVLPPNSDMIKGRETIAGFWKAVYESGVKSASIQTMEVEECGHFAMEVGHYELYGAEKQVLDKGKYIVNWKKEEGDWKLFRDIFNSSLPAR